MKKQAAEWLAASEAGLLAIPHDLHDIFLDEAERIRGLERLVARLIRLALSGSVPMIRGRPKATKRLDPGYSTKCSTPSVSKRYVPENR
jgi:hypothetical protein